MNFIFMLTQADRTVAECLEVAAMVAPLGLCHVGFKDVGVELETLRALNRAIKAMGAVSYLEVVATSAPAALNSARMAVEIGVDRLLGGVWVAQTLAILQGSGIDYYPFPGRPVGHPTRLGGDAAQIAADTAGYMALGCAGVDLLAYRATQAPPLALVAAARGALDAAQRDGCRAGELIVAGNVGSPARIADLRAAGVDGFTIGSAIFERSFCDAATLAGQLEAVLACCG